MLCHMQREAKVAKLDRNWPLTQLVITAALALLCEKSQENDQVSSCVNTM